MAFTGQTELDLFRQRIQEPDPDNSRITDPEALVYINRGRTRYAEESEAVKAVFQRTTTIGPTVLGGGLVARYPLDSNTIKVDAVRYDGLPVSEEGEDSWDSKVATLDFATQGPPFMYKRIGGVIDLFFAPSEAKVLEYLASVVPVDIGLSDAENELTDLQVKVAVDFAIAEFFEDDGRDGSRVESRALHMSKMHKRRLSRTGPRFVKMTGGSYPNG